MLLSIQNSCYNIYIILLGLESQLGDLTQITCHMGAGPNIRTLRSSSRISLILNNEQTISFHLQMLRNLSKVNKYI